MAKKLPPLGDPAQKVATVKKGGKIVAAKPVKGGKK